MLISWNRFLRRHLLTRFHHHTSDDILACWHRIYDPSMLKNIRIISYPTDCDNRSLSSMRIANRFFALNIVFSIREHPGAYKINLPIY